MSSMNQTVAELRIGSSDPRHKSFKDQGLVLRHRKGPGRPETQLAEPAGGQPCKNPIRQQSCEELKSPFKGMPRNASD